MAGFGEVQEQYTKDLERDLKQARKEINDLKSKLAELREAYSFNLDLLSNQKNELAEALDLNERLIGFIDLSKGDFDKFQEMYSKLLSMCAKEQLKEKGDE